MNKLRGLRDIPSATKSRLTRRLHTYTQHDEYEIFNELTRLDREKVRLTNERGNWQEKVSRIDVRLREIEELEESLRNQLGMGKNNSIDFQDTEKPLTAPDSYNLGSGVEQKKTSGKNRQEVIVKY